MARLNPDIASDEVSDEDLRGYRRGGRVEMSPGPDTTMESGDVAIVMARVPAEA